ncbi:MAG TPA: hypothetical protein VGH98_07235 [Gemmatimonadaceae bacterium]|jgi:hypothetical protein
MYRTLIAGMVVLVSGCLSSPIVAPSPLLFHASRPATQATQIAALTLASAGFRVAQSDSQGTTLTANRWATHNGNEDFVRCRYPKGSDAAANRATTLFITFRAQRDTTSGSAVTVGGRVLTSYPGYQGTAMEIAPNDTDCVSNGSIERQLETALR